MDNRLGNVVMLRPCDSNDALASLNRITGLGFSRWPESLVQTVQQNGYESAQDCQARSSACDPVGQAYA